MRPLPILFFAATLVFGLGLNPPARAGGPDDSPNLDKKKRVQFKSFDINRIPVGHLTKARTRAEIRGALKSVLQYADDNNICYNEKADPGGRDACKTLCTRAGVVNPVDCAIECERAIADDKGQFCVSVCKGIAGPQGACDRVGDPRGGSPSSCTTWFCQFFLY